MAPMGVFERNGAWGGGILKVSGAFSSKKLTEGLLPLVVQRSEENFLHKRGKFHLQGEPNSPKASWELLNES